MKRLVLPSIFCFAFAVGVRAQEKPPIQITPPEKLLEFPKFTGPDGWTAALVDLRKHNQMPPSSLELTLKVNQSGVCSVRLLDAQAQANDPGIAFKPGDTAVPISQAHVPAPACPKP